MARPKIRHFRRTPYIFIEGTPGREYPPGTYREITSNGFLAMRWWHKKVQEEARDRGREAQRLARKEYWSTHPILGVKSGRASGGRICKHWGERPRHPSAPRRFLPPHWLTVNRGISPTDCPLCFDRKLFKRWLKCEWGWRREEWELAELVFDKYVYAHREEHKDDYSVWKTFWVPFVYSSARASRLARMLPIVTVAQARELWEVDAQDRISFQK